MKRWRNPIRSPRLIFGMRYLAVVIPAHLLWEIAQLPLYTVFENETVGTMALYVLHCTVGDALIAAAALALALIGFAGAHWPGQGRCRVALATISLGVGYTVFSEWLNTEIRGAWAYREWMPVVPPFGTGLAPLLQWIVVPALGLYWAQRGVLRSPASVPIGNSVSRSSGD